MEFNPSVDDDEKYSQVIAPWFLNALNRMSDGKTWKRFRKIDDLIDPVVKFLVNKGFVKRASNTAEIMITEEGVTICNKEGPTGWYFQDYPIE
jgi:hypothetical protein